MSNYRIGRCLVLAGGCAFVALLAASSASAFEVNAGGRSASIGGHEISARAGDASAHIGSDGSISASVGPDGPSASVGADGSLSADAGDEGNEVTIIPPDAGTSDN